LVQLGGQPGHIRLEPPRSAIGYDPQFIEHDGDVSRHADLIGCGMAGLSLLDGALDVNGERDAAGRPGRIRQVLGGPHGTMIASPSVPLANLIGATSSCRPLN
jgi:hypothetical protein